MLVFVRAALERAPMITLEHEGLLLLFRNRISLGPECVRDLLRVPLPEFHEIDIADTQLAQVIAAGRAPDLVLVLKDRAGRAVRVLVIEVQRKRDREKERSWPMYIPVLGAKWDCDVVLLVVAVEDRVARWAKGPFETGHPGYTLTPLVIGPSELPLLLDVAQVAKAPELAVLTCVAHARKKPPADAADLARLTLEGCRHLDQEHFSIYHDLIGASLNEAARAVLENLMASGHYEYQTDFVKKHVATGRAEGMAAGIAEGRAQDVLTVLEARALPVTEDARAHILACTDLDVLERWLRKAVTAASFEEIFREP